MRYLLFLPEGVCVYQMQFKGVSMFIGKYGFYESQMPESQDCVHCIDECAIWFTQSPQWEMLSAVQPYIFVYPTIPIPHLGSRIFER